MEAKSKALKCVFVGAGSSGKTTIIHTLANGGKHPTGENDIPYYKEVNLTAEFTHQGIQYNLGLVDTTHKEEADRSRPLAYPDTDVFVVCFTPVRHGSLADARWHWSKEVIHHCPDKPIILLALKIDLRTDPGVIKMFDSARQGEINTPAEGASIAEEIGAERYLECSAVTGEGIQALFEALVDVGINGKLKKKSVNNKGGKSKTKECNIM